jgi:cell division protein ZapA
MATIDIEIAGRKYAIACRDGEEDHIRVVSGVVDEKAREAAGALGSLSEARQLLYASLLLADQLQEKVKEAPAPAEPVPAPHEDVRLAEALERLAERVESLAERLESGVANT